MKLEYRFSFYEDEPFEFEVDSIKDFIEDVLPLEDKINIYLTMIYDKSSEERDSLADDLGLYSREEVEKYLWLDDDYWLTDVLADTDEVVDYIVQNYEKELKEYYREEAEDEAEAELNYRDYYSEVEHDYWKTR